MAEPHEVMVPCSCDNVEQCEMELYVSDVRIARAIVRAYQIAILQHQQEHWQQTEETYGRAS